MHVLRYLAASVLVIIALAAGLINAYPMTDFVHYVPDALGSGFIAIIALTVVSVWKEKELTDSSKTWLMRGFLAAILLPTIFATSAFIHEDQTTWSNGEIHWHADFEVIVDGERYNLINPADYCDEMSSESSFMCSLNDRVGITEYHEHNDQRIHLEGVFRNREDATLRAFFQSFRGDLTNTEIRYPSTDGWVNRTEGGQDTLKIFIKRGAGAARQWCYLGTGLGSDVQCPKNDGGLAANPSDYVISPVQSGPTIEVIFLIYDETDAATVLEDLQDDDAYTYNGETFAVQKLGEGY